MHWPWKRFYKIICWGNQENIMIMIVPFFFCVQTKEFGKIKFCCPIMTPFVSKQQCFFSSSLRSKYRKFFKVTSWMVIINSQSLTSECVLQLVLAQKFWRTLKWSSYRQTFLKVALDTLHGIWGELGLACIYRTHTHWRSRLVSLKP